MSHAGGRAKTWGGERGMIGWIENLLIITPQVVALLAGCGALAGWSAVRMFRRSRLVLASAAGLLALLLLPAAAADAVNAHYQYLPRVADVVAVPTWPTAASPVAAQTHREVHRLGVVVSVELSGPVSGFGPHTAFVYLPPQYYQEPKRRFPVVYLVHGSPGAPVDWFRAARAAEAGLAVARKGQPIILVAPRASRYWSDDSECVDSPREHIESYLTRDVIADVDRTFRTIPDRLGRALLGNSAGGFCALNLGLRHRDLFSGIGDLSGYDRPTHDGGLGRLFGPRRNLAALVASEDPSQYTRHLRPGPTMHIYFDVGREDREARRDAERMAVRLRSRAEVTHLTERPGGHDYGVWRPALTEALAWLAGPLSSSPTIGRRA